jgi:hypothetical protein
VRVVVSAASVAVSPASVLRESAKSAARVSWAAIAFGGPRRSAPGVSAHHEAPGGGVPGGAAGICWHSTSIGRAHWRAAIFFTRGAGRMVIWGDELDQVRFGVDDAGEGVPALWVNIFNYIGPTSICTVPGGSRLRS